jgi:hypothetical protein
MKMTLNLKFKKTKSDKVKHIFNRLNMCILCCISNRTTQLFGINKNENCIVRYNYKQNNDTFENKIKTKINNNKLYLINFLLEISNDLPIYLN